jgi:hypothetical protein
LLIVLPVAMSAGEEKPGPALPPPSLYEVPEPSRTADGRVFDGTVPSAPPPVQVADRLAPSLSQPSLPRARRQAGGCQLPAAASAWYVRCGCRGTPRQAAAPPGAAEATMTAMAAAGLCLHREPRPSIRSGGGDCVKMGQWAGACG